MYVHSCSYLALHENEPTTNKLQHKVVTMFQRVIMYYSERTAFVLLYMANAHLRPYRYIEVLSGRTTNLVASKIGS
jgi:hypothetical protein